MTYMAVKDMKRTKELWQKLEQEKELIITRDGRPCAILVGVSPENVENDLSEIRRALFSATIARARQQAERNPPSSAAIDDLVGQSRRDRGIA